MVMIGLLAVGVAAALIIGLTAFFRLRPRARNPILEYRRALDTLRGFAEHPQLPAEPPLHALSGSTDHIRILSEPPATSARRRRPPNPAARASRRTRARRPPRVDYSSRPTVANLPTIGRAYGDPAVLALVPPEDERDDERIPVAADGAGDDDPK